MPYIESLADFWGEFCASQEAAATWADRLVDITRMALSPDKDLRSHFHGTSACLSALFRAERYGEIVDILQVDTIWTYRRWAVKALAAMGRKREAIRYAESGRGPWTPDGEVDAIGEEILLSSGSIEEAYEQYGLRARRGAPREISPSGNQPSRSIQGFWRSTGSSKAAAPRSRVPTSGRHIRAQ